MIPTFLESTSLASKSQLRDRILTLRVDMMPLEHNIEYFLHITSFMSNNFPSNLKFRPNINKNIKPRHIFLLLYISKKHTTEE